MAKIKTISSAATSSKEPAKLLKEGAINKKKNQKFKQNLTGKIALINGSKARNNKIKLPAQSEKEKNSSLQASKKRKHQSDEESPQKLNSSIKELVPKEEESDSEEDINEGIVIEEEYSIVKDGETDEEDSDEEEEEKDEIGVAKILGASLADDTDEDDEDFDETEEDVEDEEEEDDEESESEQKTKATQQNKEEEDEDASEDTEDEDDEEDDEDDDDDDDDEDEEEEESSLGLHSLLGNSIAEDDDDDEDFDDTAEDDEDEDISDEEEEDDEDGNNTTLNTTKGSTADESTASENLSEDKESERDKRSIFVGNLPKTVTKDQLTKMFKKFGPVEVVRIRGAVSEDINMPKKVGLLTKKLHPEVKALIAYVVFKSEDSVKAALSMNGKVFEGNHLRVDTIVKSDKEIPDPKKSVFLGNLSYRIDNNAVWEFFKDCGEIESVRVIRDNKTGASKGFGYVNFTTEDGVALALELNGRQLGKREIRVKPCTATSMSRKKQAQKQTNKRSRSNETAKQGSVKKFKNNAEAAVHRVKQKAQKQGQKNSPEEKQSFEGQKADKKKKHKINKAQKKKQMVAEKLMAKSKKPRK